MKLLPVPLSQEGLGWTNKKKDSQPRRFFSAPAMLLCWPFPW
jgi:hypothetical protein